MAKLRHYRVEDLSPELPEDLAVLGFSLKRVTTAAAVSATPRYLPPGFYYRYVEPLP
jgi:hypothetical protein